MSDRPLWIWTAIARLRGCPENRFRTMRDPTSPNWRHQTKEICIMAHRWHGKESRWGDRVNVNIPVQVSADALAGADGCMKNLSLSGALMKAGGDLRLTSLIEVSIKMPSPWQRAEVITAYVSRKVKD